MKSKRFINYTIGFLISVLLFPILLMTSIQAVTFDKSFYKSQYGRLKVAEDIGIKQPELFRVTWELLDYIKGSRETLDDIKAEIRNEARLVFNTREKDHMVDVRDLYLFGYILRNYAVILIVILSAILYFNSNRRPFGYFARSFIAASALLLLLLGTLYILIQSNFTYYWDLFHHIFFKNDLWILDPRTDILIQMVPEPFFYSAVTRVLIYFSAGCILLMGLSIWNVVKTKKEAIPN